MGPRVGGDARKERVSGEKRDFCYVERAIEWAVLTSECVSACVRRRYLCGAHAHKKNLGVRPRAEEKPALRL